MRVSEPEPAERLLRGLISVRPLRERRAAELRALAAASAEQRVREVFARDRLQVLAGGRLAGLLGDAAPAWITAWVADASAEARAVAERQDVAAMHVLAALAQAGVPAVHFKGTALARELYGDVALRSAGDIDVLVPVARIGEATTVLRGAGWGAPADPVDADGLPRMHFLLEHPGGLPGVELHWRLHYYEGVFAQQALARATGGPIDRRLAPADLLVLLLLCLARDAANNLRIAADVAAWWDTYGDEPMCAAAAVADAVPALRPALVTAFVAAERLVGLPSARVTGLDARSAGCSPLALRLATAPLAATHGQRLGERRLIDHLLAPRGQRRDPWRRNLIVSRAVARHQRFLPAEAGAARVAAARVEIGAGMLLRYAIAMARLAGVPQLSGLEQAAQRHRARRRVEAGQLADD